ncbi:MAG: V-type ATPase 116kDa subunit family protein, partial [Waddliaceae bacterium]
MRIDVKKYLFWGPENIKTVFFQKAQSAGIIEFIDPKPLKQKEIPEEVQKYHNAIKVLREKPSVTQEEPENPNDAKKIVSEILDLEHAHGKYSEERRQLHMEISRIEVFGDFSLEELKKIDRETGRKIQFFFSKHLPQEELEIPEELIYIGFKSGLDYFISINPVEKQYDQMIEMHFDQSLGTLKNRLNEIEIKERRIEEKLKDLAKYNAFLHTALIKEMNQYSLVQAQSFAQGKLNDILFVIEGWVPKHKEEALFDLLEELNVTANQIAIEPFDHVPTFLENSGTKRIGEDLVHIYDTPSITDKDPSIWVLVFFSLFFALIINDGGYGLLFLIAALFIRSKYKVLPKAGNRFYKLVIILSVATIGWGVLSNSFFGVIFDIDSPFRKVSLLQWVSEKKAAYHIEEKDDTYQEWVRKYPAALDANDANEFLKIGAKEKPTGQIEYEILDKFNDSILMELALLVGMIHVSLSFLRYLDINWSGAGWVIFIFGAYLYLPSYLEAASMTQYIFGVDRDFAAFEGIIMMAGGLSLAFILSFIQNKLYGLLEITNLIQVFADILSYLRLYALGLAGAIISNTVNDIAAGSPWIFAIFLLLIGH